MTIEVTKRRRFEWLWVAWCLGAAMWAPAIAFGGADPSVSLSLGTPTSLLQSTILAPNAGTVTLGLYLETGPEASFTTGNQIICEDALGDEVCGLQLEIEAAGDVTIQSFSPAPGVGGETRWRLSSPDRIRILRINVLEDGDLAPPGAPLRLGTLQIDVSGSAGFLRTRSGETLGVDARLDSTVVRTALPLVAVPEPGAVAMTLAGAGLIALRRRIRGWFRSARRRLRARVMPRGSRRAFVVACLLATAWFASGREASALPGEVLDEQKIGPGIGGLVGPIADQDELGTGVVGIGDLDRDGIPDLAIGAWLDDDGGFDRGAIYVLFMNADGTVRAEQKISQTAGGFGGTLGDGDRFGGAIAPLGDLDGDGIIDLAVSADRSDAGAFDAGAFWVLLMNEDGTVRDERVHDAQSGLLSSRLTFQDFFGFGLSALGDLDGDGHPELAVGAFGDDGGASQTGAVYIVSLLPDGGILRITKISESEGSLPVLLQANGRFGVRTAGIGDLDGDGTPDLAVGADQAFFWGAVYVLLLNPDGTVKNATVISGGLGGFSGTLDFSDDFGLGLSAVGDVDGDGVPDLAVGAARDDDGGIDNGAVWILFLNPDGTVKGHQKISDTAGGLMAPLDGEFFGISVGGLGDLDGDGVQDLVVGESYDDDNGGFRRGAAHVLFLDGSSIVCGNGVLDPVEECDDGNLSDEDGCNATCESEDALDLFGGGRWRRRGRARGRRRQGFHRHFGRPVGDERRERAGRGHRRERDARRARSDGECLRIPRPYGRRDHRADQLGRWNRPRSPGWPRRSRDPHRRRRGAGSSDRSR